MGGSHILRAGSLPWGVAAWSPAADQTGSAGTEQPLNRAQDPLSFTTAASWISQSSYSQSVRLADFILTNVEIILLEWESFARIWPSGTTADPSEVRDEAEDILHATAVDIQSDQTGARQAEKSKAQAARGTRVLT
jgi:hypothetical protein